MEKKQNGSLGEVLFYSFRYIFSWLSVSGKSLKNEMADWERERAGATTKNEMMVSLRTTAKIAIGIWENINFSHERQREERKKRAKMHTNTHTHTQTHKYFILIRYIYPSEKREKKNKIKFFGIIHYRWASCNLWDHTSCASKFERKWKNNNSQRRRRLRRRRQRRWKKYIFYMTCWSNV